MTEQSTGIKVSFMARRNLGNYEHFEASAEVSCVVDAEAGHGEEVSTMLADLRQRVHTALSDNPSADVSSSKEPPKKRGRPKKEPEPVAEEPASAPAEDDAQVLADLRNAATEAVNRTSGLHVVEYLQTVFGVGKVAQLAPKDRAAALQGLRELDVEKDGPTKDPLEDDLLEGL